MCTFNGADFLSEQLQSFVTQTRLPDEIVICDDCSEDSTSKIIRDFAKNAPFTVRFYINETTLGSTKNFEKAISLCDGDIIFLSDQDDIWLPEKLQLFEAEFLKDENTGLVFCNGEIVDQQLNSLNHTSWEFCGFEERQLSMVLNEQAFETLLKRNFISGCMMAFRAKYKSLICPIPHNFPDMIHDYWIALLLAAVSKVVPLQKKLVKYRQHPKQQLGLVKTADVTLHKRIQNKILFDEEIQRMLTIRERLSRNAGLYPVSALNHTNQYITHIKTRSLLNNHRLARVTPVLHELISLRYHRFSNGIMSALKDLTL